jgi:hypothetical protein
VLDVVHSLPDACWREGHIEMMNTEIVQRIEHCVDHGRRCRDCTGLTDAFDAEWIRFGRDFDKL